MATATARAGRFPNWVGALAPLVLVALLIGVFLVLEPISSLNEPPPVEAGAMDREGQLARAFHHPVETPPSGPKHNKSNI